MEWLEYSLTANEHILWLIYIYNIYIYIIVYICICQNVYTGPNKVVKGAATDVRYFGRSTMKHYLAPDSALHSTPYSPPYSKI